MKRISAYKKLKKAVERDYHICVGLDTDKSKIPIHLLSMKILYWSSIKLSFKIHLNMPQLIK